MRQAPIRSFGLKLLMASLVLGWAGRLNAQIVIEGETDPKPKPPNESHQAWAWYEEGQRLRAEARTPGLNAE